MLSAGVEVVPDPVDVDDPLDELPEVVELPPVNGFDDDESSPQPASTASVTMNTANKRKYLKTQAPPTHTGEPARR
jgi:hypothetical protein